MIVPTVKCKSNFEDIAEALEILLHANNDNIDNIDYCDLQDIIKRLKQ